MDIDTLRTLRRCEYCAHFMAEELNTGHCQLHDMYVLRDFDCEKFEQRRADAEGGELPAEREKENTRAHGVSTK